MKEYQLEAGHPEPLGATFDGQGVNFALFSETASAVELCLFENNKEHRLFLPERSHNIFHGYLPKGKPGLLYGYRVHGPFQPRQGLRFNPHKLLLDPYAKDWQGSFKLKDYDFGYTIGHPEQDLSFDPRDNARTAPKSVVVDMTYDWQDDRHPERPWSETLIYETHVKGMTRLHPLVPEALRGTYAGLASPPVIEHLLKLGVTAVELLPVHSILDDRRLRELGLANYWGYGTINYFRPASRYAQHRALDDFRDMVKQFHRAGLEVILDVVYNHTSEGSHLGPTLSFRGIDNRSYYRLDPEHPRYYRDYTGCGNTVNTDHPQVLQLVMDSLRFWVEEMHVDGFRYDLATALARHRSSFLDVVHQDPVMRRVKLIAEPWDLGDNGYQVGNFPPRWGEWNDRYRDCVRRFWRGDPGMAPQLATRLSGSSDLFSRTGKGPHSSVNFITCHDGFTLRDLVTYEGKHNLANGEDNRDGSNNNCSRNFGHEGETNNVKVRKRRLRQQKSMLACLYLSLGVPMLLGGDEMGRTQRGNNNAYCQDNPISWVDWLLKSDQVELLQFTQELARLRKRFPILGSQKFPQPEKHVLWLHPEGRIVAENDWHDHDLRSLGLIWRDQSEDLLLLMHAGELDQEFFLPKGWSTGWKIELASYPLRNPGYVLPAGGMLVATRPIFKTAPKSKKADRKH